MQSVNFRPYPSVPLKFANGKTKKESPSSITGHPYSNKMESSDAPSSKVQGLKNFASTVASFFATPMNTGTTEFVQGWKTQMLPSKSKRK